MLEAFASGLAADFVIVPGDEHPDPEIAELCESRGVRLFGLAPEAFASLSDARTPQPALAVVASPPLTVDDRFRRSEGMVLVLVDIADPGNVGTLLRTAEATGCFGVIVTSETADVLSPKVVRASAGSVLRVPVGEVSLDALAGVLEQLGLATAATAMNGTPYDEIDHDFSRPLALLLGNEAHGLAQNQLAAVDHILSIPMAGNVESLNVATAGAVLSFDHARRLRGRSPDGQA